MRRKPGRDLRLKTQNPTLLGSPCLLYRERVRTLSQWKSKVQICKMTEWRTKVNPLRILRGRGREGIQPWMLVIRYRRALEQSSTGGNENRLLELPWDEEACGSSCALGPPRAG